MNTNGRESHPLRAALEALGGTLTQWTVMSKTSDPFRLDVERNHINGAWLRRAMADLEIIPRPSKKIHGRGIHYALTQVEGGYLKPDGARYANTDDDADWIDNIIGPARWLGYLDWDATLDKHSDEPITRISEPPEPVGWAGVNDEVTVPDEDDLARLVADATPDRRETIDDLRHLRLRQPVHPVREEQQPARAPGAGDTWGRAEPSRPAVAAVAEQEAGVAAVPAVAAVADARATGPASAARSDDR